jgi:Domain of unknown function (DUF4129)
MKLGALRILFVLLCLFATGTSSLGNDLNEQEWKRSIEHLSYPMPDATIKIESAPVPADNKGKGKNGANEYKKVERDRGSQTKRPQQRNIQSYNPNLEPLKIILYIFLGVIFIVILIWIVKKNYGKRGEKQKLQIVFDVENPDELIRSELENELDNAFGSGNFSRCLRYHFLLMLEVLQDKGEITWHKYSTNGEYLRELSKSNEIQAITTLTYIYEFYWYGGHILNESRYHDFKNSFESLNKVWQDE